MVLSIVCFLISLHTLSHSSCLILILCLLSSLLLASSLSFLPCSNFSWSNATKVLNFCQRAATSSPLFLINLSLLLILSSCLSLCLLLLSLMSLLILLSASCLFRIFSLYNFWCFVLYSLIVLQSRYTVVLIIMQLFISGKIIWVSNRPTMAVKRKASNREVDISDIMDSDDLVMVHGVVTEMSPVKLRRNSRESRGGRWRSGCNKKKQEKQDFIPCDSSAWCRVVLWEENISKSVSEGGYELRNVMEGGYWSYRKYIC